MKIKWYGTASLLVEGGNTRILIDPYLKKLNPALFRLPLEEAASAQAIFITHPHLDHFSDIGTFLNLGMKNVFVSPNGIDCARGFGLPVDAMTPIRANERYTVGEIEVCVFQSRHCKNDLPTLIRVLCNPLHYRRPSVVRELIRTNRHFRIADDVYALEFSHDGKKLLVLGSAGMDENTEYPFGADLLVFPYQGRTRMHRVMIPFLERLRPKAVMPDHFDNAFPPITHTVNTKKFIPTVKRILPEARAFLPTEGEWYEV